MTFKGNPSSHRTELVLQWSSPAAQSAELNWDEWSAGEHSVQPQLPCREQETFLFCILIIDCNLKLP